MTSQLLHPGCDLWKKSRERFVCRFTLFNPHVQISRQGTLCIYCRLFTLNVNKYVTRTWLCNVFHSIKSTGSNLCSDAGTSLFIAIVHGQRKRRCPSQQCFCRLWWKATLVCCCSSIEETAQFVFVENSKVYDQASGWHGIYRVVLNATLNI